MCEVVFLMTCPPCVFNASLKDLLFSNTSSPVLAAAVNACLAVDFSKSVKKILFLSVVLSAFDDCVGVAVSFFLVNTHS